MLAYLAQHAGRSVPRETLRGLLWADSAEEQARASLRQALSALKRALGESGEVLEATPGEIRLRGDLVDIDTREFRDAVGSQDVPHLESATSLWHGDFLEGIGPVAPEFDRWVEAERAACRAAFGTLLLRMLDAHQSAGKTEDVIATAHRLLVQDPLQEHVHRKLMRAYLSQRRHDAALKQFNTLRDLLRDELGVSPEKQTLDLVRDIQAARAAGRAEVPADPGPQPSAAPAAPLGRPSIAVLAFRPLTPDPDSTFFGEGIAEDVITELARESGLLVVSRHSSFRFSETDTPIGEIGAQLGVRFLLGGSVRVAGTRMRATAHLVECATGRETWSERFDREIEDIFAIQTEIARTVTATVVGRITEAEAERTRRNSPETLESYTMILCGLRHMHRPQVAEFDEAEDWFARAVEASPDSARALGLLATTRIYRRWYFDIDGEMSDILPLAERAIALDPREPKAHCALGIVHTIDRNFDRARYHFEAGLSANPNDDLLLVEYGRFLMYDDRSEEGLERIRESMRLNPLHPNWYWNIRGRCLHTLGRFEEALDAFGRIHTPPFYVPAYRAACLASLGRMAEAVAARDDLYRQRPDFDLAHFMSIFPYRNPETAERFFETLRVLDREA